MHRVEFKTKDGKKWFYASFQEFTDAVQAANELWGKGTTQVPPEEIQEVILTSYARGAL